MVNGYDIHLGGIVNYFKGFKLFWLTYVDFLEFHTWPRSVIDSTKT